MNKLQNFYQHKSISEAIDEYNTHDITSFHMPSHKNNKLFSVNAFDIDYTEIYGLDNLNNPQDTILYTLNRIEQIYKSKKSYILTNGSTSGILASIISQVGSDGFILVGRDCHSSVFSAIELCKCGYDFIYKGLSTIGVTIDFDIEEITKKIDIIQKNKKITAICVTSPNYEGVVIDIPALSKICKLRDILLIVDEAHGACFNHSDKLPISSMYEGADIVIQSLHKTLPALTPTALLHICSDKVNIDNLNHTMQLLNTSSPSYVFMYTIDKLMISLQNNLLDFNTHYEKIDNFLKSFKQQSNGDIRFLSKKDLNNDTIRQDITRLVFWSNKLTGEQLHTILLHKYKFNFELYIGKYVIGITSVADNYNEYDRLLHCLLEIENEYAHLNNLPESIYSNVKTDSVFPFYTNKPYEELPLRQCIGRISAVKIIPYPPCIPLVFRGELITEDIVNKIEQYIHSNVEVMNINNNKIKVFL